MKKQILNFVLGAMTVVSTCGVAEAQYYRPASEYSQIGKEACDRMPSYGRQDCYESIRGVFFDSSLRGYCSNDVPVYSIQDCLNATGNKSYDPVEVDMCRKEPAYNRVDCAKRFGRNSIRMSPTTPGEIVGDVLDQVLIDLINEYFGTSAVSSSEVCDVQNSTGRSLGTVSRSDFRGVAQRFARSQGSCVVTNIKDERSSRELISPSGKTLGYSLTEKETNALKDRNYYERCRILTCVSQTRQVRRPRIQDNRYDRYDNNYGGGYQMPTPTWGTR